MRGVTCAVSTIIQISKIFLLISFAMFCPRLFLFYSSRFYTYHNYHDSSFRLGLENINESTRELFSVAGNNPRIALITNQSSVDQKGERAIDILFKKKMHIKKIVVPASGKSGVQHALKTSACKDAVTGVPICSLYNISDQLRKNIFDDVDMLVFDVPDISLSYAQYIQVLSEILMLAAKQKKAIVVLDRPNLTGAKIEGAVAQYYTKDITVPLRSGMTVGELSNYINNEFLPTKADLRVVPMCQYRRSSNEQKELLEYLSHMELPTCLSSGNSFLGLIAQVEPFDVGIGTDRAFECLLLPESLSFERQKWYELQISLRNSGIESRFYRHFCSIKKEYYSGLRFSMQSIRTFSTVKTLISVLTFFKKSGLDLTFSACFDTSVGTSLIREVILGMKSYEELKEKVNTDLQAFFDRARQFFMYTPLPELMLV